MKWYWLLIIPLTIVVWLVYRAIPFQDTTGLYYTFGFDKANGDTDFVYYPAENFWKVNRK